MDLKKEQMVHLQYRKIGFELVKIVAKNKGF